MRRIKLTLEYDGTDFAGWQAQAPPARTVQQVLEDAVAGMVHARVAVRGAGRTDARVHARGQVADFATTTRIPDEAFFRGLNSALPPDVAVVRAEEVPLAFDARRSAIGKHYAYRIWNQPRPSPLRRRTSWHVVPPLSRDLMRRAAAVFVGEHDFSSFRAAEHDPQVASRSAVRTIHRLELAEPEPGHLVFDVEGSGFLKHMIRNLVGTLVEVGLGRRDDLAEVLAARDRKRAGRTAPGHGLTLESVTYPAALDPPMPVV